MTGALLGLSSVFALLQAVTVDVRTSTPAPALGEVFEVTLRARGPAGARFEFPKEIVEDGIELKAGRQTAAPGEHVYRAQLFALGDDARVPQISVPYWLGDGESGTARTAALPLQVSAVIRPEETNPNPAPFAPPVPVTMGRLFWLVNGPLALALLALILYGLSRLRSPRSVVPPVSATPLNPEEEARRSLEKLAKNARADARAFYIDLMQVAKRYLGQRLEAPVPEMTTQETLAFARQHDWISPHAGRLKEIAGAADWIKFGGGGDGSLRERHLDEIRNLIEDVAGKHAQAEAEAEAREREARALAGRKAA